MGNDAGQSVDLLGRLKNGDDRTLATLFTGKRGLFKPRSHAASPR